MLQIKCKLILWETKEMDLAFLCCKVMFAIVVILITSLLINPVTLYLYTKPSTFTYLPTYLPIYMTYLIPPKCPTYPPTNLDDLIIWRIDYQGATWCQLS